MGNWMKRKNEYMKIKNEILSSEVQENTTFTGKLEELKEIYNLVENKNNIDIRNQKKN